MHWHRLGIRLVGVLLAAFCGTGTTLAEVVYSTYANPSQVSPGGSFSAFEVGQQVQLGGTSRRLQSFQFTAYVQEIPTTADFQVRFYANDGTGGAPGTLLGQTSLFENVELTGQFHTIGWGGLDVVVPDVFTWTVQIYNADPVPVGVPQVTNEPVVGDELGAWFGSQSDGWASATARYEAFIFAVPEPSTWALAVCAAASLIFFTKRVEKKGRRKG